MAAYRFYDPAPVFWDLLGTTPIRNGYLQFYDIGTTTPKSTWSDADLTVLNSNPVMLTGDGRSATNIFLDGSYTVVIHDSEQGTDLTRDVIPGGDGGFVIPPLVDGAFLTNNGATLEWETLLKIPDPSGQDGKVLTAAGLGVIWQALATPGNATVTYTANTIKISNGTTAWMLQTGSGSAPASGSTTTTVAVLFPTAFSASPLHVEVCYSQTSGASAAAGVPIGWAAARSSSGFSAQWDTNGFSNIVAPVQFTWFAIGTVAP